jgi:hypothetical protein
MAENIIAGRNVGWDCGSPRVVIGDEFIGCPCSRHRSRVIETTCVNFKEFQFSLVNRGAISITVCEVIYRGQKVLLETIARTYDWAMMRRRPCSPLQLDCSSSFHWGRSLSRGCLFVTYDIWVGVVVGCYEAIVAVYCSPSDNDGLDLHVWI